MSSPTSPDLRLLVLSSYTASPSAPHQLAPPTGVTVPRRVLVAERGEPVALDVPDPLLLEVEREHVLLMLRGEWKLESLPSAAPRCPDERVLVTWSRHHGALLAVALTSLRLDVVERYVLARLGWDGCDRIGFMECPFAPPARRVDLAEVVL